MDLKDKRALITGGTSGMGIGAARSMAEKGASVILTGRDETRGVTAVEEIRAGGQDAGVPVERLRAVVAQAPRV